MTWLESALAKEYEFVKALKNTETTQLVVYRHKISNKKVVKRVVANKGEVFFLLSRLYHKNLSNVLEVVKTPTGIIVLEEFVDGMTIGEYLEDNLYSEKGVKTIVSSLCDALAFLHSNKIIHKDIKPENVMIDNSGNVRLIDFDASRLYKPYKSEDTVILGTTGYAAPEQYGINQTDERTDIYALGVLMNVMLTGEVPERKLYNGKLKKIIVKCTQTIPDNRYQNVVELKRNL